MTPIACRPAAPTAVALLAVALLAACPPPGGGTETGEPSSSTATSDATTATSLATSSPATTDTSTTAESTTDAADTSTTEATGAVSTGVDEDSTTAPAACDPVPGEAFGPCLDGGTCNGDLTCLDVGAGTVCRPPCGECGDGGIWAACLNLLDDGHSACPGGDGCVAACGLDGDFSDDCHAGTVCDPTIGACVWPDCVHEAVPAKAWGPCNVDGTCDALPGDDGGVVLCIALGEGLSACLPACALEGCPDFKGLDVCGAGHCDDAGACVHPCALDTDCPLAGMKCDAGHPNGGACGWPVP